MRILHFSDIHEGALPAPFSLFSKSIFGGFNYVLRRKKHVKWQTLERLTDQIDEIAPDLIIISGDFTTTGSPKEFLRAKQRLQKLRDEVSVPILAVPGNHDKYLRSKQSQQAFDEFLSWLTKGLVSHLPMRLEYDDLVVYLTDLAVPRPIHLSSGYLDDKTITFLEQNSARDKDKIKVHVGHYPLLEENGEELAERRALENGKKLLKLLQNGDIDISLCGHIHRAFLRREDCGSIENCAGSLTMGRKANILENDGKKIEQQWKIF